MKTSMPTEVKGAPTIAELAALIRAIKPDICDDYVEEVGDIPSIMLTIGADENGWSYQTGDNSYTGGAYSYARWGVGYVTRRRNSRDLAREILDDLAGQCF